MADDPAAIRAERQRDEARAAFDELDARWLEAVSAHSSAELLAQAEPYERDPETGEVTGWRDRSRDPDVRLLADAETAAREAATRRGGRSWRPTTDRAGAAAGAGAAGEKGAVGMAITAQRVTVWTSAVALMPAESDVVGGARLLVRNSDATNSVSLGPSNVTANGGHGLGPGAVVTVEMPAGEQLHAIRDGAADVVVHVLRLGV